MIHPLCLLLAYHRIKINQASHFVGGPGIEETLDIDADRDHGVGQSDSGGRA